MSGLVFTGVLNISNSKPSYSTVLLTSWEVGKYKTSENLNPILCNHTKAITLDRYIHIITDI